MKPHNSHLPKPMSSRRLLTAALWMMTMLLAIPPLPGASGAAPSARNVAPRATAKPSARSVRTAFRAPQAVNVLDKEALHQRMRDIEAQTTVVRTKLAANPRSEKLTRELASLQQEFDSISASLGGDRPVAEQTLPTPPSVRTAIFDQMKAIDDQAAGLKQLAAKGSTVEVEAQIAQLQAQYDELSASLGSSRMIQMDQTLTPHVVPSPPAGCVPVTTTFTQSTPVAIPTGPAVVTSTVVVSGVDTNLFDLDLTTFIMHTFAADLDITIQSPAGTVVTLTTDNGGSNDNVFNGTVWDDDANPGGQVPYTTNNGVATDHAYVNLTLASPLVPEEALGAFIGEDPNGTWTITISDDLAGDGGSLDMWSLGVTTVSTAPVTIVEPTFTQSTPVAIPTGPAVVSSTLVVSGVGTSVYDVNLTTFIMHTFAADLDITIQSPAGTVVTLTTDNGGSNDNVFNGTVWDDDANPGGQVPYTTNNGVATDHAYVNLTLASPLVPEEALGAFIGEDPNGTWTITISDDLAGDGGSLDMWSLNITTATCAAGCMLTCPADITVSNDAGQCGAVVTFTPTTSGTCGTIDCVPASGSFFPVGTTTVTCTDLEDTSPTGMAPASCSFTVTVNDTEPPVVTCPANITQSNDEGQCGAVVSYVASATDNCPGVGVVCAPASGSFFPVGATSVTCTATDASSNMASCGFTVTVNDTEAPSITCPSNISITSSTLAGCGVNMVVTYTTPSATDNCPGVGAVTCMPASGSTFDEGTTTVTCTAMDAVGNTGMCTFTVTVSAPFTFCALGDGTGDTFSIVTTPGDPAFGFWRYHIAATNTTICGVANFVSHIPGVKLRTYDNNYSAENPTYFMDATFGPTTGTVYIKRKNGTIVAILRDQNLLNDPPCNGSMP